MALGRNEGEFQRYSDEGAHLVGIIDCGGCEGNQNRIVCSLANLKMHLVTLNEEVDALHMGTCIMKFCKRKDDLLQAVRDKAGVEVIEGTHPYSPPTIFGQ